MSWQQIEDILFDGTEDDIKNLSCPECKTPIYYTYNKSAKSLKYGCKKCGISIRSNGCFSQPNCYHYQQSQE